MNTHADKTQENKNQFVSAASPQMQISGESTFQFVDNRPEAIAQRKLQEMANNSPQAKLAAQLKAKVNNYSSRQQQSIQKKENNTGLPDNLKTGMENLSGYSMDDVKVHYNSDKPAQLQAHAYAQGTDIHLASGQEKHLPHEAWHVVQQKQGRVKPTMQMKGNVNINDDAGLEKEADVMGKKALTQFKLSQKQMFQRQIENKSLQKNSIIQCSTYKDINEINDLPSVEEWKANLGVDDPRTYRAYVTHLLNIIDDGFVVTDEIITRIIDDNGVNLDDDAEEGNFNFRAEWNNALLDLIDAENRPAEETGEKFKNWLSSLAAREGNEELFPTNSGELISRDEFGHEKRTKKFTKEKQKWQANRDIKGIKSINYKLLPVKTQQVIKDVLSNEAVQGVVQGKDGQARSVAPKGAGELRSWHQNQDGNLPQVKIIDRDSLSSERSRNYFDLQTKEYGRVQNKQKSKQVEDKFHISMIEINAGFGGDPTGPRLVYDYFKDNFYITFGHYKSKGGNPFILVEVPSSWGKKPQNNQIIEGITKIKKDNPMRGKKGTVLSIDEQRVKIRPIDPDGDCMYNATIQALGLEITAQELRGIIGQRLMAAGDMRGANRAMLGEWGERDELIEIALHTDAEITIYHQYGAPEVINVGGNNAIKLLLMGDHYRYIQDVI